MDLDEGVGLDDAQLGGGHAGEVARLPNIEQRQDILSCRKAAIYIYQSLFFQSISITDISSLVLFSLFLPSLGHIIMMVTSVT